jgi:hypothetical protein
VAKKPDPKSIINYSLVLMVSASMFEIERLEYRGPVE